MIKSLNFFLNPKKISIINIIKSLDDKYNFICLVGHEPLFSNIITLIDNKKKMKFPTASMAKIIFFTICSIRPSKYFRQNV